MRNSLRFVLLFGLYVLGFFMLGGQVCIAQQTKPQLIPHARTSRQTTPGIRRRQPK